jgi:Glycosyl hydrolase catalytic core
MGLFCCDGIDNDLSSSGPPPLPGKKGAAMTLKVNKGANQQAGVENLPRVIALNPYWNYSWGLERLPQQPDHIEFVPMVWGVWNLDQLRANMEAQVVPHIKTGVVKRILAYNEPDKKDQSNMTLTKASEAWPILESLGVPIVGPSCASPLGEWMTEFVACGHHMDWVGVHWYGGADFSGFCNRMKVIYEKYKKPLILTEFAAADWQAKTTAENRFSHTDVLKFMKKALPWLEEQDWIAGYAWFSFELTCPHGTCSALFDKAGKLTGLGRYYASVRTENTSGDQTVVSYR